MKNRFKENPIDDEPKPDVELEEPFKPRRDISPSMPEFPAGDPPRREDDLIL